MARRLTLPRLLLLGASLGVAFSLISGLGMAGGPAGPTLVLSWVVYGAVEGILITGTALVMGLLLPRFSSSGVLRGFLVFGAAFLLHAGLSWAAEIVRLGLGGATGAPLERPWFLSGVVALFSVVVGEAVGAREIAAAAREEADRARRMAEEARIGAGPRLDDAFVERYGISAREREIADLLLAKLSYAEIGERLFISVPTVKSHASSVYARTGVASRREFGVILANHTESRMSGT